MSFTPKTTLEKILCGVTATAKTRLEKAVQTAMARISSALELPVVTAEDDGDVLGVSGGKWAKVTPSGGGSGLPEVDESDDGDLLGVEDGVWKCVDRPVDTVVVPFTVTIGEQGAVATTDAVFSEVADAIAAGKNIIGKATISGLILCGGLTTIYPDTNPTVLAFCFAADNSNPGAAPAPQMLKIMFSSSGCAATLVNLAVAT